MVTKWFFIKSLTFIVFVLPCLIVSTIETCTSDVESCNGCRVNGNIRIRYCGQFSCERKDEIFMSLEKSINKFILSNLDATNLILENVPLTNLTPSVCRLTGLLSLELSNNCLEEVPVECFKGFMSIERIRITDNKVNALKKGVFNGLGFLKYVEMERNNINHIDEEVFFNRSDLLSLTNINLGKNRLTSVGAWIFIWPQSSQRELRIDLKDNLISTFTNSFNWTFDCKNKLNGPLEFELNLSYNNISHINDLVSPYFKNTLALLCMLGKTGVDNTIQLRSNRFICDCVDFRFATIGHLAAYSSAMSDVQCKQPIELQDIKLISVPLDDFVCKSTTNCVQGCLCIEQPSKSIFYVYCNHSYQLGALPESLPKTKLHKYFLNFSETTMERLERKEYFDKISYLDISNSKIRSISDEFLISIKHIEVVHLHGNLLATLPREAASQIESFLFKEITLYRNPWNCNCENLWLKSWINKSRHMIKFPESMYCAEPEWNRGKSILAVEDSDFCSDPNISRKNQLLMKVLIPILSITLLMIGLGVLVRTFKVEIHAKFNIHPFDRDECEDEHMLYDVFISSSYQDRRFAIELVRTLEGKGYCVCYHEKDFLSGPSIASNICRAVTYSKRVVCILSDDFLKSPYCMYEFQYALDRNIRINRNRLIALLSNSFNVSDEIMSDEMFAFLSSHTYIQITEASKWLDQLCYSLTVKKIVANSSSCLLGGSETELMPQRNGNASPTDEPSPSGIYII